MCQTCKEDFYTVESFKKYKCYILKKVEPEWELAWLVPIAGLLHFKMAAARNVFPSTRRFPYQFLPTSWAFKYLVCSEYTILTHLVLSMGLPVFYMLEVASLCILNYFLSFNFFSLIRPCCFFFSADVHWSFLRLIVFEQLMLLIIQLWLICLMPNNVVLHALC